MSKKITRVCTVHPVSRPGHFDDNYRTLPPLRGPMQHMGKWHLVLQDNGVDAMCPDGAFFVPMSNIASIDYE